MKEPRSWLDRGLQKGLGLIKISDECIARVISPSTISVSFTAKKYKPEPGLRDLPDFMDPMGLGEKREHDRREAENKTRASFFNGMRELARRLASDRDLMKISVIEPDQKYPPPLFDKPLTRDEFIQQFGSKEGNL